MPKLKDPISPERGRRPFTDDRIPSEHHISVANRLLLVAARFSWTAFKLVAKTAIRIPRLFVKLNTRPTPASRNPRPRT